MAPFFKTHHCYASKPMSLAFRAAQAQPPHQRTDPWLTLPSSLPSPTTWASTWALDFLICCLWSIFKTEWRWFCYNVKTDHVSLLPETFQWFPLPLSESQHLLTAKGPVLSVGPCSLDSLTCFFLISLSSLSFSSSDTPNWKPISSLFRCQNETGLDLGLEGQKFVYAIWKNAMWRTIFNKIEFKIINRKLGIKVNII